MSESRYLTFRVEIELRDDERLDHTLAQWLDAFRNAAAGRPCKVTVNEGPQVWYCTTCVAIAPTLEEKSLHERFHGHTMEIPRP